MDDQTVRDVVAWLKANEDNELVFRENISGTPAEMFLSFLANPEVVNQDDEDGLFPHQPSQDGCNFVHTAGQNKGARCHGAKAPGSNRCEFHKQPVFCEKVWDYVQNYHSTLNKLCQ